ncbi:HlyD family efflux transporter periplasmic adaptor subunit [Flavonifractor plautii]|uniref:HlyD family efflux transporter periplasmic adaptor subunit n=1 Tax=Flavonifractor plautii TaxID=292800 RepID=UPI001CD56DD3|nr:HlyD family efflux transporter periplasmic adaptor subunit [Flavonifractor plautii]MCB5374759.1 HlyD family efflux transporter periplasmic adaptor subunit [Flavonifractor plautii]UBS62104.1 HlyD family efflux transporter periplasmic adaptor subunit [Flavonifractor plautii]
MQLTALRKKAEGSAPPERKPGRRLTVRRGAALLLVLALAAGAALGGKALFFSGEEQTPLTEQTTYGSLSTTLSGTGTTMPADSVTYTTASEAEITGVYVSAGDTVEVGELLYTQDDSELDDQIEEYQDQITEQENQLDDYQEQLAQLQEEIAALTVKAPFAGRITDVAVDMGDNMAAGTKLATLVDDSQMCLTQYFSYAYEDQVYVGMKAGVSVASLMLNQEGTVTDIQMVDRVTAEGTHCFAVTVTLDNPGAFTEGMTGAGYLVADSGEKLYPSVDGELEYRRSQDLTAEVGGEVTGIGAVDYEQVSAGAVLVQLDGADYQKQVESVNKQITQTQEKIVQLQEKSAEAEEKRSDYAVTAELAGKIIMVNVREGESPREAGQTAVVLYNLDSMTITANIDELDIDGIAMGMEVDITQSGAESDTHYTGTVTEISYEATNSNGVAYFPITITIPSGGALSAGVNVSYSITVGDESEGVLAPIAALKSTSQGTCLFVKADAAPDNAVELEDGVVPDGFYAVPVETGVSNSRYVRILSGVEEGVEVFTRYQQTAPSGGDTTSQGQSEEQSGFPGGGEMPDFGGGMPGGMGGGMPGGGPMG